MLKNINTFRIISLLILNSCANRGDARKTSPDPYDRIKANKEQGKGFRLKDLAGKKGGTFDFASSNELWRASLDTIDFMPLTSANYSGGIIITDWYSENENSGESIKITIRFLTNEIRSDAIDLKIFYKVCNLEKNCKTFERTTSLVNELKKEILKRAAIYQNQSKDNKSKKSN